MCRCSLPVSQSIPVEYRKIADTLFPPGGYPEGTGPETEAVLAFAESLGIGADYKRLLAVDKCAPEMRCFLGHFQNNLDLLIQKTWVEKADEIRKEKLQARVPPFISCIEQGGYQRALTEFASILEELSSLLFGAQSRKEDFTEYTFRIDTQMGLFWWYGSRIGGCEVRKWAEAADKDVLRAILLLGLCYLTNF